LHRLQIPGSRLHRQRYGAPHFLYDLTVMDVDWIGKQTVAPSLQWNNSGLWGAKSIRILAARIGVSTRALTNFN
jgi:hypothetical protein